jgi:hypothetical protein
MSMPDDPFGERADLPTEYPSDHKQSPPPRRSRRRLQVRVGLCGLLLVLIAVLPHHSGRSRKLPAGMWGQTIACLERDQIDKVTDVRTGVLPDASTTSVLVSRVRGGPLAELIDAGSASAAQARVHHPALNVIDPAGAQSTGSVVWSYALNGDPPREVASAGDRTLIHFCLTTPDRR